ncbi:hypothetical protein RSAG8_08515, partial [Rhizoctonia solani AG-8 WAC10335]
MQIIQDTESPAAAAIISHIAHSQRVVILTGAGISRAGGIPDFRSEDGLYQKHRRSTGINPKDILHVDSLCSKTGIQQLYSLLHSMWLSAIGGSHTNAHVLIALIYRISRLAGYFTQNIDGLDESLGILPMNPHSNNDPWAVLLQMHGSLLWLRCTVCTWKEPVTNQWWEKLQSSETHISCPACPRGGSFWIVHCAYLLTQLPESRSGRPIQGGFVRPNIILSSASLVQLVKELAQSIRTQDAGHVIFINRDPPPTTLRDNIDFMLGGDLQIWCNCIMSQVSGKNYNFSNPNTCIYSHSARKLRRHTCQFHITSMCQALLYSPDWPFIFYRALRLD